jgi:hypothetical protein
MRTSPRSKYDELRKVLRLVEDDSVIRFPRRKHAAAEPAARMWLR